MKKLIKTPVTLQLIFCVSALVLSALTSVSAQAQEQPHALFEPINQVLTGPRCLNCHTARDFPTQGNERRVHDQHVVRGEDNFGAPTLRCQTCHQDTNTGFGEVPGAPNWHLAPKSMAWENIIGETLSAIDVCESLKDTSGNGGRTLDMLVDHVDEDVLVNWAFAPGKRDVPSVDGNALSHSEFVELVRLWADAGGPCASTD